MKNKIKNEVAETVTATAEATRHEYPDVVKQIHREFDTAADEILAEAKEIIARDAESAAVKKGSRLANMGFTKAPQAVEAKETIKKLELSKDAVAIIEYFMVHYPHNKFITEQQVATICKKYNLVKGGVQLYKGFVPEKNLTEIENFKMKEVDMAWGYDRDNNGTFHPVYLLNRRGEIKVGQHFNIGEQGELTPKNTEDKRIGRVRPALEICAPVKDMDMTGMTINDGYRIEEAPVVIPDPIVLQIVKGGYLIVTAWGDEASDPIVRNENMN